MANSRIFDLDYSEAEARAAVTHWREQNRHLAEWWERPHQFFRDRLSEGFVDVQTASAWSPVADGSRCGSVAVFPGLYGSWEPWRLGADGWERYPDDPNFATQIEAQAVALSRLADAG